MPVNAAEMPDTCAGCKQVTLWPRCNGPCKTSNPPKDPTLEYQGRNRTKEYCGNCGTPVTHPEETCPQCGYWFDAYDNSIITDEKKAEELREKWKS